MQRKKITAYLYLLSVILFMAGDVIAMIGLIRGIFMHHDSNLGPIGVIVLFCGIGLGVITWKLVDRRQYPQNPTDRPVA